MLSDYDIIKLKPGRYKEFCKRRERDHKRLYKRYWLAVRKGGRAVYCTCLENRNS